MKTMKKYVPIFILIFIFSFYLVSQGVFNMSDPTATTIEEQKKQNILYEGVVKKFSDKNIEGKDINFKEMPKVLIVNFWASWCTPCLEEFPSLVSLYSEFKEKGLQVVAINTDERTQEKLIEKTKKRLNLNFDIIPDKDSKWVNEFSIDAIPVSIIFYKGKVQEVSQGSKDFDSGEFKEKVEQWLKS